MPAFAVAPPTAPGRADKRRSSSRQRVRHRDDAHFVERVTPLERMVLHWVEYHAAVTTNQILRKFWTAANKSTRNGNRLIQRLGYRGLLEIFPLEPAKGRASIRVVRLTKSARLALGMPEPTREASSQSGRILRYRMQFAEMILNREAEGWMWIESSELSAAIRELGLEQYRQRVLTGTEQACRELLLRSDPPTMPFHGLRHTTTGQVRLVVPAHTLSRTRKALSDLPTNLQSYAPEFGVEIVPIGHPEREAVGRYLTEAEKRLKVRFHRTIAPHFSVAKVGR